MKLGKTPAAIPDENVLDLRTPRTPVGSTPDAETSRRKHVDFLSAVEDGEHALQKKFASWFTRTPKQKPPIDTEPDSPDVPEPTLSPAVVRKALSPEPLKAIPQSSGPVRWGPAIRFGAFVGLFLLVVIAARFVGSVQKVKGDVLGASAQALQNIVSATTAAQNLQFGTSKSDFTAAHDAFAAAEQQLEGVAGTLKDLPGAGKISRAESLLQAGQAITSAATFLADGATALSSSAPANSTPLLEVIKQFHQSLNPASLELQKAAILLQQVQVSDLPQQYQQTFSDIKSQLPSMQLQFQRLRQVGDFLQQFLAADGATKHYLMVFQNTNEIRPTGGFLGSLAIVDMQNGVVQKVNVPSGGVYDLSGQTSLHYIAPQPLQLIQPNWNLQDANWFPDFPTSAKKILQFYNSTGDAPVDGVIAVTPAVLESFLQLTGPVTVPEVGMTFTADNLQTQLQTIINQEKAQDITKPKLVLGYLTPKILERVFALPQTQLWQMLGTLQNHLISRDVQMYFTNANAEQTISDLGWGGQLRSTDRDFLHLSRANMGGGKTDGVIDEVDSHDVTVASDGTITDTLTIIRKDNGQSNDLFTKDVNVIYLRAYVPQGSTLLNASGFETIDPKRFSIPDPGTIPDPDIVALDAGAIIDAASNTRISTEAGHTIFGNWLTVGPGETVKATITYTLPFKLHVGGFFNQSDSYSLLTQMQPGTRPAFSSILHLPQDWATTWQGSTADVFVKDSDQQYRMSSILDRDQYYGVVVKK